MHDPIVCLISSFREGELIQGAIRSVVPLDCPILVWEGSTHSKASPSAGVKTDLGLMRNAVSEFRTGGAWSDEAMKRNEMLDAARKVYGVPFWILTVDADEILLWAEYLPDWLNALRPGHPRSNQNVVPMKITVPGYDEETKHGPATYIQPSRLVHSSLIAEYTSGLLTARTPDGHDLNFSGYRSELPPLFGEPHIHHRYYLRRPDRVQLRGADLEKIEFERNRKIE